MQNMKNMKMAGKIKMLSNLAKTVSMKTPKDMKNYADKFANMQKGDDDDEHLPPSVNPENYHYYGSPMNDSQQDDADEEKANRFKKYRSS